MIILTLLKTLDVKKATYAIILILASALFFWLGKELSSAEYERELRAYENRIKDISEAIVYSQNEAIKRHNQELEVERRRTATAKKERALLAEKSQGIVNETVSNTSGAWTESQRLRIKELYHIYGYAE